MRMPKPIRVGGAVLSAALAILTLPSAPSAVAGWGSVLAFVDEEPFRWLLPAIGWVGLVGTVVVLWRRPSPAKTAGESISGMPTTEVDFIYALKDWNGALGDCLMNAGFGWKSEQRKTWPQDAKAAAMDCFNDRRADLIRLCHHGQKSGWIEPDECNDLFNPVDVDEVWRVRQLIRQRFIAPWEESESA